jgi:hypothetical protein
MSRWMLYRKRYQRKRNALLLLTLSGSIRPADVEVPYYRERMASEVRGRASSVLDPIPKVERSIWFMDIRELVFRKACRPLSVP